jgi:hypothetical protein
LLKRHLKDAFHQAYKGCEALLNRDVGAEPLRAYLWREFLAFEDYDQVTFPILYGTDVGEAEPVEILRISPVDAVALIDEATDPARRKKLAGAFLFNFGGFLDPAWRANDVLWGRLDAAERLITSILPDPLDEPARVALIREAHLAVLEEWSDATKVRSLAKFISCAVMRASDKSTAERHMMPEEQRITAEKRIAEAVASTLTGEQLLQFVRKYYEVDRRLDPQPLLESISRATQVIGKMFEDIASRQGRQGTQLRWITRLGGIFWGLVQVAVPGSIGNMLFNHWLKLLVAFESTVLLGGLVLSVGGAVRFGGLTLLGTVLIWLAVAMLKDRMSQENRWRNRLLVIVFVIASVLMLVGVDRLFGLGWMSWFQPWVSWLGGLWQHVKVLPGRLSTPS